MKKLSVELEDGFSNNDRYLIEEYLKNGTDDFLLAVLGQKTFVVPYKYRKVVKNETGAIERFKNVLLDFQAAEINKYMEAGLPVSSIQVDGMDYVLPYQHREKNVSSRALANYVENRAAEKYDMIIATCRELEKHGVRLADIDFSMAALAKYQHRLEQVCEKEVQNARRVQNFCSKAKGKKSKTFNLTTEDIAKQAKMLANKAVRTVNFIKQHNRAFAVTAIIGLGFIGANLGPRRCSEFNSKITVPIEHKDTKKYFDFRGVEHSDTLGNIARIMENKAEISAMLISVEGYAAEAYKDGVGVLTIGSGTTFYLDDDGNVCKVAEGDKTTPEKAMDDKWRFIEAEMLELLGDNLGRSCSDEELMATIGAGFCWGKKALANSKYYEALCAGESCDKLARKLTGFRKQKGLLKREYLISACLEKKWTAKDLLDMPIYEYNGQYLNGGIYRLALSDIMPCQRDRKGELKKDENGHHLPRIGADDFCSFYDNYGEIKQKLMDDAKNSTENVKRVRDFLPKEMIKNINLRAQAIDLKLVSQKKELSRN